MYGIITTVNKARLGAVRWQNRARRSRDAVKEELRMKKRNRLTICLVAGVGGKDHRDGSLAYYFSEPVVCNDAKGVGPLVLAYTEMIARKN